VTPDLIRDLATDLDLVADLPDDDGQLLRAAARALTTLRARCLGWLPVDEQMSEGQQAALANAIALQTIFEAEQGAEDWIGVDDRIAAVGGLSFAPRAAPRVSEGRPGGARWRRARAALRHRSHARRARGVTATPAKLAAIRRRAAGQTGVTVEEYEARRACGERYCGGCRKWLPLAEFMPNRAGRDGRTGRCRACHNRAKRDVHARHRRRGDLAPLLAQLPPDLPALERVRLVLELARRAGLDFACAWPLAVAQLPAEWADAVPQTREGWQRAFEREPATPSEVAAGALVNIVGVDDDVERGGRAPVHIVNPGSTPAGRERPALRA